jgi:hypothetical protein
MDANPFIFLYTGGLFSPPDTRHNSPNVPFEFASATQTPTVAPCEFVNPRDLQNTLEGSGCDLERSERDGLKRRSQSPSQFIDPRLIRDSPEKIIPRSRKSSISSSSSSESGIGEPLNLAEKATNLPLGVDSNSMSRSRKSSISSLSSITQVDDGDSMIGQELSSTTQVEDNMSMIGLDVNDSLSDSSGDAPVDSSIVEASNLPFPDSREDEEVVVSKEPLLDSRHDGEGGPMEINEPMEETSASEDDEDDNPMDVAESTEKLSELVDHPEEFQPIDVDQSGGPALGTPPSDSMDIDADAKPADVQIEAPSSPRRSSRITLAKNDFRLKFNNHPKVSSGRRKPASKLDKVLSQAGVRTFFTQYELITYIY